MGLAKEYIEQKLAELQALAESSKVPSEIEFVLTDTEFTAENGKVYLIANNGDWTQDLSVKLPDSQVDDVPVGFACEVFVAYAENGYNTQVTSSRAEASWVGDEAFELAYIPYPLDMKGQHVRFTYVGLVPPELSESSVVDLWLVSRLDNQLGDVRIVALATTAALPSHTTSGNYATRKLIGDSGTLTIDGQLINQLGPQMSILVKDEASSDLEGIYYPIAENPWELRRRSDFCFDQQIDVVGAGILVTKGSANKGKMFYSQPGDNVEGSITFEEAGGGGGIVPDFVSDDTAQYTDAAWHNISTFDLPNSGDRVLHLRSTIFARRSATGGGGSVNDVAKFIVEATLQVSAGILTTKDQTLMYVFRDAPSWSVFVNNDGALQVRIQVIGQAGETIEWRCQTEISEHG